jgi:hypothetical protein
VAKDKTKDFTYAATVTINGEAHKLYFRKDKQRMEFINRARFLEGVSNASIDIGVYVYDDAEAAINMVANFASRLVKI